MHKSIRDGKVKSRQHIGFVALLYYSAVRQGEALKARPNQFQVKQDYLYFDVEEKLKAKQNPIRLQFVSRFI
jgi:integrase